MQPPVLDRPWLSLDLGAKMPVLSWAINSPGLTTARRILWREVRNADLPENLDVEDWLAQELAKRDAREAVCFLTSCNIADFAEARVTVGGVTARALATVGLSNAEAVGSRRHQPHHDWGTINISVQIDSGLNMAARLEALSIATEARTAEVMNAGLRLPTGLATGTGTDCIAIAAPEGNSRYAGLHTEIGEAVGRAVRDAVAEGVRVWMQGEFAGRMNHG